jgi:hypothetical protein
MIEYSDREQFRFQDEHQHNVCKGHRGRQDREGYPLDVDASLGNHFEPKICESLLLYKTVVAKETKKLQNGSKGLGNKIYSSNQFKLDKTF